MSPEGIGIAHVERRSGKRPRVRACAFRPLGDAAALAELVRRYHLRGLDCTSVLPPAAHSLLLVEAPAVEPAELRAAVRWRVKDLIDFHIDDAVLDVFSVPGNAAGGRADLMYVVAARKVDVQGQVDLIEGAKLELRAIDIPALALRNIAALLPEDVQGVAMLHLTARGGLITLTRQATLYLARSVESDSHWMAEQQASGTDTAPDTDVQQWKRLDGIVLEIQRSLDYYEGHFAQPPITNLVVAPNAAMPPGLVSYVANSLGLSAGMLDLNELLDCDAGLTQEQQSQCLLALGAALRVDDGNR